jgi:hypothetical protein
VRQVVISAGRDLEAVLWHIEFKYLFMEGEQMRNILKTFYFSLSNKPAN